MNITDTSVRNGVLVTLMGILFSGMALSQESPSDARMRRVEEEVAKRRKVLERAYSGRGVVFGPLQHPPGWHTEAREYKIENATLIACGQTFATLARKEVMISARITSKTLTISTGKVTGDKAFESFVQAIESQGILIVPVGRNVLVLIDASDEKGEGGAGQSGSRPPLAPRGK